MFFNRSFNPQSALSNPKFLGFPITHFVAKRRSGDLATRRPGPFLPAYVLPLMPLIHGLMPSL